MPRYVLMAATIVTLFGSVQAIAANDAALGHVRTLLQSGNESVRVVCLVTV